MAKLSHGCYRDLDPNPAFVLGIETDGAAVNTHDFAHDREPEPSTGRGRVALAKAVERRLPQFKRHSLTFITHDDADHSRFVGRSAFPVRRPQVEQRKAVRAAREAFTPATKEAETDQIRRERIALESGCQKIV